MYVPDMMSYSPSATSPERTCSAAKLSAAIVLLGGAVALSIAAVISSIALGFKPWDRFNTAETLKDLSSDEIKPGKITALIAGMGAASVLTAIGGLAQTITTLGGTFTPMTDLAKDLGGFAKNVKPFIALDMLGVASNYRVLNEQVMDKTGGLFENFTILFRSVSLLRSPLIK